MRLKEQSAVLWDAFPEAWIPLAEVVTDLAGQAGIILVLSLAYWLVHRKKALTVTSYTVAGVVVVLLVKSLLGLPRPIPDPAIAVDPAVPLTDDPYGFPSGHAFLAVVLYGGMLYLFDRHREPIAAGGILVLIVAIGLTRVFLRLHYLGDVIAGLGLGILFLAVVITVIGERPALAFGLGAALAIPTLLVSGFEEYVVVAFGASLGGLLVCRSVSIEAIPPMRSRLEGAMLALVGLAFIVGLMTLDAAIDAAGVADVLLAVLVNAVLITGVLLAPIGVHRLETARHEIIGDRLAGR